MIFQAASCEAVLVQNPSFSSPAFSTPPRFWLSVIFQSWKFQFRHSRSRNFRYGAHLESVGGLGYIKGLEYGEEIETFSQKIFEFCRLEMVHFYAF